MSVWRNDALCFSCGRRASVKEGVRVCTAAKCLAIWIAGVLVSGCGGSLYFDADAENGLGVCVGYDSEVRDGTEGKP